MAADGPGRHGWLPLDLVQPAVPRMQHLGVSRVARSPRGFLTAYRNNDGNPWTMGVDRASGQPWWRKREGFVARHVKQARDAGEALWDSRGEPTRRHLALVAWAYTPDRRRWKRWVARAA